MILPYFTTFALLMVVLLQWRASPPPVETQANPHQPIEVPASISLHQGREKFVEDVRKEAEMLRGIDGMQNCEARLRAAVVQRNDLRVQLERPLEFHGEDDQDPKQLTRCLRTNKRLRAQLYDAQRWPVERRSKRRDPPPDANQLDEYSRTWIQMLHHQHVELLRVFGDPKNSMLLQNSQERLLVIITQYPLEASGQRVKEYLTSLQLNVFNSAVEHIYLLQETITPPPTERNPEDVSLREVLRSFVDDLNPKYKAKITWVDWPKGRLVYGDALSFGKSISSNHPHAPVGIINADVAFDYTLYSMLHNLHEYEQASLAGEVDRPVLIMLSRRRTVLQPASLNDLDPNNDRDSCLSYNSGADAFIYSNIGRVEASTALELSFVMGTRYMEERIASLFHRDGWLLLNPCFEVNLLHFHKRRLETDDDPDRWKGQPVLEKQNEVMKKAYPSLFCDVLGECHQKKAYVKEEKN